MFKDRKSYFQTLIDGKHDTNSFLAPKKLLELLLNSAVDFYSFVLKNFLNVEYDDVIVVGDPKLLSTEIEWLSYRLGQKFPEKEEKSLKVAFDVMDENETRIVNVGEKLKVLIKKLP